MESILAWVHEWWWLVLLAVAATIKVLNLITKHWSAHTGLVRWCLFLVDVLDVIKSTPPPAGPVTVDLRIGAPGHAGMYLKNKRDGGDK